MAKKTPWTYWVAVIGIALAVLAPVIAFFNLGELAWVSWVIAVIGLVLGYSLKVHANTLIAGLVILSISGVFSVIPQFGTLINQIFGNLAIMSAGLIAIPAVRTIANQIGIKM